MDILATFPTTQAALGAERILLEQGLPVELIPVPSQIHGDCGFFLRVDAGDPEQSARRMGLLRSCGSRELWRVDVARADSSSRKVKIYERIT